MNKNQTRGRKVRDYVVDDAGRKKAVIIELEEFTEIMEYVEEIEDALDLKKAVDQGKEFIELRDFVQQIRIAN